MQAGNDKNFFQKEELIRLLGSDEGKALVALLQKDSGKAMQLAVAALKKGDYAQAQQVLTPVFGASQTALLMEKLRGAR